MASQLLMGTGLSPGGWTARRHCWVLRTPVAPDLPRPEAPSSNITSGLPGGAPALVAFPQFRPVPGLASSVPDLASSTSWL